ncbi:unnamed protein product [Darwinula stevensoni]|uniref:Signal recognition particle subunit SRP72 n=1 Tax=Darwinula stevensoni TaxID=69355 RepID=A0A7R9AEX9_9CRUS|nr:unnamed protein product [Darwinula stevensoni]CAG0902779.1 unnamed protein product [Darwinula stevensoni]
MSKEAAPSDAETQALYGELNKQVKNGELEKVIKTANKILQNHQDEEKAFICKVVAMLQLGKFQDALSQLTNTRYKKFEKNLVFEKAYCLYRLNRNSEALNVIREGPEGDMHLKELNAQIMYRLERYQDCFELYKDIIKNTIDDYQDERETNLAAVFTNLIYEGKDAETSGVRSDTFELAYNTGCILLAQGKFQEAKSILEKSVELCHKTLEDDGLSPEEIEEEIGIIRVQLGYCLQVLEKEKEALALYNAVLKAKPQDAVLTAVASNNIVAIHRDQNVFDSKKKMKMATLEGLETKLTKRQQKGICINQCLLSLYVTQMDLFSQLVEKLEREYPDLRDLVVILRALEKVKEKKDRRMEACKVLEGLPRDTLYQPGIISALVTLSLSLGDSHRASNILADAVAWHRNSPASSKDAVKLTALWRQSASLHLREGRPELAAESLTQLYQLYPDDVRTLAQLITAYAQFKPEMVGKLSERLPPPPQTRDLDQDLDSLEGVTWALGAKLLKKGDLQPPTIKKTEELLEKGRQEKKKKKRKKHLPKDYDPNVDPDPERWLPRRERTGYRRRRDRRDRDRDRNVGKGTQGATTEQADKLQVSYQDMSKQKGKNAVGGENVGGGSGKPAPPAPPPSGSTRKKGAGGGKKKGKH